MRRASVQQNPARDLPVVTPPFHGDRHTRAAHQGLRGLDLFGSKTFRRSHNIDPARVKRTRPCFGANGPELRSVPARHRPVRSRDHFGVLADLKNQSPKARLRLRERHGKVTERSRPLRQSAVQELSVRYRIRPSVKVRESGGFPDPKNVEREILEPATGGRSVHLDRPVLGMFDGFHILERRGRVIPIQVRHREHLAATELSADPLVVHEDQSEGPRLFAPATESDHLVR
ncbi:MAG: hypothetical protein BWY49_00548 [Candidatus Omnitrophica bacterium ADurb.Bin314]|nr:MAG: hypothetical protein BWY49_00548 [Candidatus Omnitrophica bacterium ADurb.Bin314]